MFDLNLFADLALAFFPAVAAALFTDAVLAWSSLFGVIVGVVALVTALDNVRHALTLARDDYYLAMGSHHWLHPHCRLNADNLRLLHIYLLLGRILLHVRLLHRLHIGLLLWIGLLRVVLLRVGAWLLGVYTWLLRISAGLLVYLLLRRVLTGRILTRRVHSRLAWRILTGWELSRRVLTGRHLVGLLTRVARLHFKTILIKY